MIPDIFTFSAAMMVAATKAASKTASGGSAAFSLIFLALIVVVGYYLLVRPQRQRVRRQQQESWSVEVGNEILTSGGVVGTVVSIDGDRITLESVPGTRFVIVRQAVAKRMEPQIPDPPLDEWGLQDSDSSDEEGDGDLDLEDEQEGSQSSVTHSESEDSAGYEPAEAGDDMPGGGEAAAEEADGEGR